MRHNILANSVTRPLEHKCSSKKLQAKSHALKKLAESSFRKKVLKTGPVESYHKIGKTFENTEKGKALGQAVILPFV